MSNEVMVIDDEQIKNRIYIIRNKQVMIDREIAEIFDVTTKRLNEQVKRNIDRFPPEFCFQLNETEKNELVANCDQLNNLKYSSVCPYAFTEQGIAMLTSVLRSDVAVKMSIQIINAFVNMRKFLTENGEIFKKIDILEKRQLSFEIKTETKFENILNAIEDKSIKPKQGIFYNGQIFDSYVFVADLIKSAEKSIVLIDNYIDETVLMILSKRKENCKAVIYTKNISEQLKLDLKKHNAQYPKIEIKEFSDAHDRFLIIDNKDIYCIGASLKDLGKKWFAFSKFESGALEILRRLGNEK